MTTSTRWKIDKSINVSILIVLAVQFAGFIYWISTVDHNVDGLNKRVSQIETWREQSANKDSSILHKVSENKMNIHHIKEDVSEIKTDVKALLTKK